jgi:hypothetical protein
MRPHARLEAGGERSGECDAHHGASLDGGGPGFNYLAGKMLA